MDSEQIGRDIYEVNLTTSAVVGRATLAEWRAAKPLSLYSQDWRWAEGAQLRFQDGKLSPEPSDQALYGNHTLPKSGKFWPSGGIKAMLLSPDRGWVALQSFDDVPTEYGEPLPAQAQLSFG
jgi:hypothetical protein